MFQIMLGEAVNSLAKLRYLCVVSTVSTASSHASHSVRMVGGAANLWPGWVRRLLLRLVDVCAMGSENDMSEE